METGALLFLDRAELSSLFAQLERLGYSIYGPQARDGAIVFDQLQKVDQLPQGWQDIQKPGSYQLEQTESPRYFHWANGPQAIKPLLFSSREVMWQARKQDDGSIEFVIPEHQIEKVAVIGAKACDVAALKLQDQHFLQGEFVDPGYKAKRQGLFIVAVNCSRAASTCFCASTGDGPSCESGFDLCLTELEEGFLIEVGSDYGEKVIQVLNLQTATAAQLQKAEYQKADVIESQGRQLRPIAINQLQSQRSHPQWDDIAERCLACGNCTMVCPTCFCHRHHEEPVLDGKSSEHVREWDSCFGESHGELAGFQVRKTVKQRYQQWMIHKLDTWQEQYERSGCTGCGRCMSWCPAEIDFVKEANTIGGEPE